MKKEKFDSVVTFAKLPLRGTFAKPPPVAPTLRVLSPSLSYPTTSLSPSSLLLRRHPLLFSLSACLCHPSRGSRYGAGGSCAFLRPALPEAPPYRPSSTQPHTGAPQLDPRRLKKHGGISLLLNCACFAFCSSTVTAVRFLPQN